MFRKAAKSMIYLRSSPPTIILARYSTVEDRKEENPRQIYVGFLTEPSKEVSNTTRMPSAYSQQKGPIAAGQLEGRSQLRSPIMALLWTVTRLDTLQPLSELGCHLPQWAGAVSGLSIGAWCTANRAGAQ